MSGAPYTLQDEDKVWTMTTKQVMVDACSYGTEDSMRVVIEALARKNRPPPEPTTLLLHVTVDSQTCTWSLHPTPQQGNVTAGNFGW